MSRPRVRLLIVVGLAAFILTGAFWGLVTVEGRSTGVFPGVSVSGIELGGLTRDECLAKVRELETRLAHTPVEFTHGDQAWGVEPAVLGLRVNTERIAMEALAAGRSGFFVSQWLERRQLKQLGLELDLEAWLEQERFREVVGEMMVGVSQPAVDAGYHIADDDTVQIIPHQDGYQVDFDQLYSDIIAKLLQEKQGPIVVPLIHQEPEYKTADVEAMGLTGLLATFSTSYDASMANRSYNISVAANALNNLLVAPEEVVSFNSIVGPRSSEAGYRTAPVIIENQLRDGLGGGVCQVTTTLYNAVLLANLEILERKNHSLPVDYVPAGRDATVVYGAVDFKFRNNSGSYIFLKVAAGNGRVTVKVFGNREQLPRVEVRSWTTETITYRTIYEKDHNLQIGQEVIKQAGLQGYRAQTERWIWKGEDVTKENLPGSFYQPVPKIVAVGTQEPVPTVVVLPPVDTPERPVDEPILEMPPPPPVLEDF